MEKEYDFLILLISSDDLPCYSKMKIFAKKYYNLFKDRIKYFFIELKEDLETEIFEDEDVIYVKGTESLIPGIYIKSIKCMNYVNEKYKYDFLIRTNLSSFWNLNNLLTMKSLLPKNDFSGGQVHTFHYHNFISGTGIILSKDVCVKLAEIFIINNIHDDVYISELLISLGCSLNDITTYGYKIFYLIDNDPNLNLNTIPDLDKVLYFRIKNENREIDLQLFKILSNYLYNINTDEILI